MWKSFLRFKLCKFDNQAAPTVITTLPLDLSSQCVPELADFFSEPKRAAAWTPKYQLRYKCPAAPRVGKVAWAVTTQERLSYGDLLRTFSSILLPSSERPGHCRRPRVSLIRSGLVGWTVASTWRSNGPKWSFEAWILRLTYQIYMDNLWNCLASSTWKLLPTCYFCFTLNSWKMHFCKMQRQQFCDRGQVMTTGMAINGFIAEWVVLQGDLRVGNLSSSGDL